MGRKYHFWKLGVVAALNKYIIETYGAKVLAPPWERKRVALPPGMMRFEIPVLEEEDWQVTPPDDPPEMLDIENDVIELEQVFWAHPEDAHIFPHSRHYSMRMGIGEKTKILAWSIEEKDERL